MTERTPEPPRRAVLPHILVPWAATEQPYRGRAGGTSNPLRQVGDRRGHADKLKGDLETARNVALGRVAAVDPEIAAEGFALSVEGWSDVPGYRLAVQSLDTSGAKVAQRNTGDEPVTRPGRGLAALRRGE
jgi:hypothetical protein